MPRYKLTVSESNSFTVEVEAKNAIEAEDLYTEGLIDIQKEKTLEHVCGENYVVVCDKIK